MSPELPLISGKAAVQALERAGFVPLHRELNRGTLASVLRQAGLSAEEFLALL